MSSDPNERPVEDLLERVRKRGFGLRSPSMSTKSLVHAALFQAASSRRPSMTTGVFVLRQTYCCGCCPSASNARAAKRRDARMVSPV